MFKCMYRYYPFILLFSVIKVDNFTRMLWDIYTTVRNEGLAQVMLKRFYLLYLHVLTAINEELLNSEFEGKFK